MNLLSHRYLYRDIETAITRKLIYSEIQCLILAFELAVVYKKVLQRVVFQDGILIHILFDFENEYNLITYSQTERDRNMIGRIKLLTLESNGKDMILYDKKTKVFISKYTKNETFIRIDCIQENKVLMNHLQKFLN